MSVKQMIPLLIASATLLARAEELYHTGFARDAWEPSEWIGVKSARFDYVGEMLQEADHITNKVVEGADDEALQTQYCNDSYACLMLDRPFRGGLAVSATMSFDYRMAPLLVLSGPAGTDAAGRPEHREHYEFVLFDEGVNVWHYTWEADKPVFHLEACLRHPFQPQTRYQLRVAAAAVRQGKFITVEVGGEAFAFSVDTLPEELFVGFAGCEGRNRFYDFTVSSLEYF